MTSRPGPERAGSDRPIPEQDGDGNAAPPGAPPAAGAGSGAVDRIVERFGGIRPMAHKLDIPVTTVQGWKKRGAIPLARHADLRAAAARHAVALDDADLDAATPTEDRAAGEATLPGTAPADSVILMPPATDSVAPGGDTAAEITAKAAGSPVPEAAPLPLDPEAPKPDTSGTADDTATSAAANTATNGASAGYAKPDTEPARIDPATLPPPYVDEPRPGSAFATTLSVVALLVGAAALAEPWWGPRLPGWPATAGAPAAVATPADPALRAQVQQLTDRLGRLEERSSGSMAGSMAGSPDGGTAAPPADGAGLEATIRQLSDRIDGLEKRPAGGEAPPPDPRVATLTERLGGIEQRLAAVAGTPQAAQDLRKDLEAVKQQVTAVGQTVESRRDAATAAQALVLAAGQLRASLAAGQPFQQDLQGVRALGIGDAGVTQPLDAVAPFAAKGIPTRAQLADRFRPLASEIVRAAERGAGGNWFDQVTGKLATLVTVRRQGGGVVGTSPDAIVARAEAAMEDNNLAKAVEELSALEGPGAEAAAPWLTDAKARLAADQAGRQLTERAIVLLSTAAGAGAKGTAAGTQGAAQ